MALINCKNLSLSYDGQNVVTNLNFSVNQGDYLCVVGENGSGKSTLIKALLSLKKPAEGEIIFGDGLVQTEIGYLPQQTGMQKDFPASVWEIVISGCLNSGKNKVFYSKSDRQRAEKNLQRLEILPLKNQPYSQLSGGQQQRVLLARALCATKKLLLLDEPVASLDPLVTSHLYEIINDINKEGITIIMVSHDIVGSVRYASHVLSLSHQKGKFFSHSEYLEYSGADRFLKGENHD